MALGIQRVTIDAIFAGVDGSLLVHYCKLLSGIRAWGGAAEVRDSQLLSIAQALPLGSMIYVTVVTDWDAVGLPSWIENVELISVPEPAASS